MSYYNEYRCRNCGKVGQSPWPGGLCPECNSYMGVKTGYVTCPTCNGKGIDPYSRITCSNCRGKGQVPRW